MRDLRSFGKAVPVAMDSGLSVGACHRAGQRPDPVGRAPEWRTCRGWVRKIQLRHSSNSSGIGPGA